MKDGSWQSDRSSESAGSYHFKRVLAFRAAEAEFDSGSQARPEVPPMNSVSKRITTSLTSSVR
jgi:hypothetical protein